MRPKQTQASDELDSGVSISEKPSEEGFFYSALIFPGDLDQLEDIQQIVQGVGAIPELMLAPEACGYRQKSQLIDVRGFRRNPGSGGAQEAEPLSGKKPSSVQERTSMVKEVPVEIQKVMKDLSNALFKFGSFKLGETEKGYLDTVADWIKSEPEISVEIGGHTDSVGSDSYNQKLSEQRAKAVHDYIVSQGVDKSRLSYKGYGESEPIATNETEAGRQRNRRVELKILQ